MKKTKIWCLLIFMMTGGFANEPRDHCQIIDEIVHLYLATVKNELGLSPFGYGGAMMDNVKEVYLSLSSENCENIDSSRQILVKATELLLFKINGNEELRPHLNTYPFTVENLKLDIGFCKKKALIENQMENVYLFRGEVEYDITEDGRYTPIYEEPYSESLKIVQDQGVDLKRFVRTSYTPPPSKPEEIPEVCRFWPTPVAPPVKLAIPKNFRPASDKKGKSMEMYGCVLWGTEDTFTELWGQKARNEARVISGPGAFMSTLCTLIYQNGPDSFDGEEELKQEAFESQDIHVYKEHWGNYPILVLEDTRSDSSPFAVAWIGLNCDGSAIQVNFMYSNDSSRWKEEQKIWHRFIHETRIVEGLKIPFVF